MNLETLLIDSIEMVNARAAAYKAFSEPRKRFRQYKIRYALDRLEAVYGKYYSQLRGFSRVHHTRLGQTAPH